MRIERYTVLEKRDLKKEFEGIQAHVKHLAADYQIRHRWTELSPEQHLYLDRAFHFYHTPFFRDFQQLNKICPTKPYIIDEEPIAEYRVEFNLDHINMKKLRIQINLDEQFQSCCECSVDLKNHKTNKTIKKYKEYFYHGVQYTLKHNPNFELDSL